MNDRKLTCLFLGTLAALGCGKSSSNPSGLPTVEEACNVTDVDSGGTSGQHHNVEFVAAGDVPSVAGKACANDAAESVGPEGYIAARVADADTGRRSVWVSVGPRHAAEPWIDSPSVFPATVDGWHFPSASGDTELFAYGAITATDPTKLDPAMEGRFVVYDDSGDRQSELTIPKEGKKHSLVHDVCQGSGDARFHVIVSVSDTLFGLPQETVTSEEEMTAQMGGPDGGCFAYSYATDAGWERDPALGNVCACAQIPGARCEDPCFRECVYGMNGEQVTSGPVCGPDEDCTGAAGVENLTELAQAVGMNMFGIDTANCVPKGPGLPSHCGSDSDCTGAVFGFKGTYCIDQRCVDCRSDDDCADGTSCRDGECF